MFHDNTLVVEELWKDSSFRCIVVVNGEQKARYELRLQQKDDVVRQKVHYTRDAALAEARRWREQIETARRAATSRSTLY